MSSPDDVLMYGVPSHAVDVVWEEIVPLLEPALEVEGSLYSPDDIYFKLAAREMQLWVAYLRKKLVVFGITTIRIFNTKKIATLVYVGGKRRDEWHHLLQHIHSFARVHGCDEVEVCGRPGWERILEPEGYKKVSVVLRKPIPKEGISPYEIIN